MNKSLSYTEITYKKVVVISGDSLWSIAKQEKENNMYYANKDIRAIIDELKYINHLSSSNLNIGDELDIPII